MHASVSPILASVVALLAIGVLTLGFQQAPPAAGLSAPEEVVDISVSEQADPRLCNVIALGVGYFSANPGAAIAAMAGCYTGYVTAQCLRGNCEAAVREVGSIIRDTGRQALESYGRNFERTECARAFGLVCRDRD